MKKIIFLLLLLTMFAAGAIFAQDETRLTTIVPDQTVLRTRRGVIGETWNDPNSTNFVPNASIPQSGLLVEGSIGIGVQTPTPAAMLDIRTSVNTALNITMNGGISSPPAPALNITSTDPNIGADLRLSTSAVNSGGRIRPLPTGGLAFRDFADTAAGDFVTIRTDTTNPGDPTLGYTLSVVRGGAQITGNLSVTGNITATGTITPPPSDLRLKKNIETLSDNTLDKVLKLRGVTFDWRREEFKNRNFPEGRQIGIIAQELEKEFPELVTTNKDGYKAIAYDRLTAVLLEAGKDQQKEIESLKREVDEIKSLVKK